MQREAFLKLNWQKRRGYLQGELAKLPLTSEVVWRIKTSC
jgi:hypothetical protein